MIRLSREVRFALIREHSSEINNSWAGWPSTTSVVPQLRLVCVVAGDPDTRSGYVCNIQEIDQLIRKIVTDEIIPDLDRNTSAENLIQAIYSGCRSNWTSRVPIVELSLHLSPFLKLSIETENEKMICLTQQFEFSAAHRLHCPDLSDEENRQLFGKCNNPDGHGHNYIVEISIQKDTTQQNAEVIELQKFEATVKKLVIDRLDHKHLNKNVACFSDVNPSVENIAIAIWNWLDGQLDDAKLANVRVYETPKTWADYREQT